MLPSPEHRKKLNDETERLCDVWKAAYGSELGKTVRTPEQEHTPKDRKEGRKEGGIPPPILPSQSFKL